MQDSITGLEVMDLNGLINAYEYRAGSHVSEQKVYDELINPSFIEDLNSFKRGLVDTIGSSAANGNTSGNYSTDFEVEPIVNEYDATVDVEVRVPVRNVINWDVNYDIKVIPGNANGFEHRGEGEITFTKGNTVIAEESWDINSIDDIVPPHVDPLA